MPETFNSEESRARFQESQEIFNPNHIGRRLAFIVARYLEIVAVTTPNDLNTLPKDIRVMLGTSVARYLSAEATDEVSYSDIAVTSWQQAKEIQNKE